MVTETIINFCISRSVDLKEILVWKTVESQFHTYTKHLIFIACKQLQCASFGNNNLFILTHWFDTKLFFQQFMDYLNGINLLSLDLTAFACIICASLHCISCNCWNRMDWLQFACDNSKNVFCNMKAQVHGRQLLVQNLYHSQITPIGALIVFPATNWKIAIYCLFLYLSENLVFNYLYTV